MDYQQRPYRKPVSWGIYVAGFALIGAAGMFSVITYSQGPYRSIVSEKAKPRRHSYPVRAYNSGKGRIEKKFNELTSTDDAEETNLENTVDKEVSK